MSDIKFAEKISTFKKLNKQFSRLDLVGRIKLLYETYETNEVLVTSSFGADSAILLHLISKFNPSQKIFFIDTGFHFPETYAYKKQLTGMLDLQVIDANPTPKIHKLSKQYQLWETDPDTCCFINKVQVLESLQSRHKIWVSGLMGYQTEHRSKLQFFSNSKKDNGIIKCCPILDMDKEKSKIYKQEYQLPAHPLTKRGFCSIGCKHCTVKGEGRNGRWAGRNKTECGLHIEHPPKKKKAQLLYDTALERRKNRITPNKIK